MKKAEIKALTNSVLIVKFAHTFSTLISSYSLGKGVKQQEKLFRDLASELIERELLTEEDFKSMWE